MCHRFAIGKTSVLLQRPRLEALSTLKVKPHMPLSLENLHLSESSEQLLQLPSQCLFSCCTARLGRGTSVSETAVHHVLPGPCALAAMLLLQFAKTCAFERRVTTE